MSNARTISFVVIIFAIALVTQSLLLFSASLNLNGRSINAYAYSPHDGPKAADPLALKYSRGYLVSHNVAISGKNVYAVWQKDVAGIYPYISVAKLFFAASHNRGITFSRAISLTGDDINSQNPHVAAWKDNVYVLYTTAGIHTDRFGVGFVASHDGGKTFDHPLYLDNETGEGAISAIRNSIHNASIYHESTQPVMAASGRNVYVAWLDNSAGAEHVIFTSSHDGGRTFEPTIALENKLAGVSYLRIVLPSIQPQAAVSSSYTSSSSISGTACGCNVYVVLAGQSDRGGKINTIVLQSSHNGGRTFGPAAYLAISKKDHSMEIQNLQVAADASGNHVYFLWQDMATNDYRLMFSRSNEDGSDFQEPISLGTNQNNIASQQVLATGNGDDVYVLWQGSSNAPSRTYGLLVASSHDAGATFKDAVRVGQNAGNSWVVDPQMLAVGTHVYVLWEESQQVFFGISKDAGKTFQKPISISS